MDGNQGFSVLTNKKLIGTWPPTSDSTTMTIKSSGNSAGNLAFPTGNSEAMRIISNRFIGIGITAPDEKLTVKGNKVDLQRACAPDYVFQKYYTGKSDQKSDYIMSTLAEIESSTNKNHHFPNMPSALEVQQNGVLGQMSNVLLRNVEELTLYAIEHNKVIVELKVQVKAIISKKQ